MNDIKIYEQMGIIYTHGNSEKVYILPLKVVEQIMKDKNLPSNQRPEVIDLRKHGYGWESLSMIRGADELDKIRGEIEYIIYSLDRDTREEAKHRLEERKEKKLLTKTETLLGRLENRNKEEIKDEYIIPADPERVKEMMKGVMEKIKSYASKGVFE